MSEVHRCVRTRRRDRLLGQLRERRRRRWCPNSGLVWTRARAHITPSIRDSASPSAPSTTGRPSRSRGAVTLADRGVDVDVPGDEFLGIGLGLQLGEDPLPGAVPLPATEKVVHPGPRAVSLGHIPPRSTGTGAKPYAVDQLPSGPYRRAPWLLARGQQQFHPGPLRIRQVSTCHM